MVGRSLMTERDFWVGVVGWILGLCCANLIFLAVR